MSALLTFRRYGPEASEFWARYQLNAGSKLDGKMDAIQALEERMLKMKSEGRTSGSRSAYDILRVSLSAFETWRSDGVYSHGIKALQDRTMGRWLTAAKNTKRSW